MLTSVLHLVAAMSSGTELVCHFLFPAFAQISANQLSLCPPKKKPRPMANDCNIVSDEAPVVYDAATVSAFSEVGTTSPRVVNLAPRNSSSVRVTILLRCPFAWKVVFVMNIVWKQFRLVLLRHVCAVVVALFLGSPIA